MPFVPGSPYSKEYRTKLRKIDFLEKKYKVSYRKAVDALDKNNYNLKFAIQDLKIK